MFQSTKWEKEIAAFEQSDRRQPPKPGGIVFVGSSTIRLWKTLTQDYAGYPVLNRGFGGSQLADSTYFATRIIAPYQPRQVVLFAGTNDIADKRTPRQVATDFNDYVQTVRQLLPRTRLSFIEITSSPSRWDQRDTVIVANAAIRQLSRKNNVDFIPARERFFGRNGEPRPELFVSDRLHLNAAGYQILTEAVRPFLSR